MKKTTKSASTSSITGPTLTNAQKIARDLAKAKQDTTKAKAYQQIAAAEKTLGHTTTAAHDVARAKKDLAKAAKEVLKAKQVGLARAGARPAGWLLGRNDQVPTCGAVAVANSLLAATGREASDADVLALYEAAGGGQAGADMAVVLDVLAGQGIAGVRPRSISARRAAAGQPLPAGAVAVVDVPGWTPHVVAVTEAGPVSWGTPWPAWLLGHAVEAWVIDW